MAHPLSNMLLSIMKLKNNLCRNFLILQSNVKRVQTLVVVILEESLQAKTINRVILISFCWQVRKFRAQRSKWTI